MLDYVQFIDTLLREHRGAMGLPSQPQLPGPIRGLTEDIMKECSSDIGSAAQSDAFKCSQDRHAAIVAMTLTHLPTGSRILVSYSAPGHLARMMQLAGYEVTRLDPHGSWLERYNPSDLADRFGGVVADLNADDLPFGAETFDCIVVTGVLERLLLRHPQDLMPEFRRVLTDRGVVILSTPNVCNISNIVSLMQGNNIFWDPEIFYGGTDRYNREFTPREVRSLLERSGFQTREFFGVVDHANWRSGSAHHVYDFQAAHGTPDHDLMRNTIIGVFAKS